MNSVAMTKQSISLEADAKSAVCLFVLMMILSGCGAASNMAEVKGQVLLDGEPLTTGKVNTMPAHGRGARGTIDSAGRFTLTSGDLGPGASCGTHYVAVVAVENSTNLSPEAPRKSLIPQRYANPETSGLKIDVTPDEPNDVVLELSSKE